MIQGSPGQLPVVVYAAAVVLSVPAAGSALLLARRVGVRRAAAAVALVVAVLAAVVGLAVTVLAGPAAGARFAASGFGAMALLWALPVRAGDLLLRRATGVAGEEALGFAVAGLPAGLLGSFVWFAAPGGLAGADPGGPVRWLAGAGFLLTVVVGPGLAGVALHRLVRRRG